MDFTEFRAIKASKHHIFTPRYNPVKDMLATLELEQVVEIDLTQFPADRKIENSAKNVVSYGIGIGRKVETLIHEGKLYAVYTGPYVKGNPGRPKE